MRFWVNDVISNVYACIVVPRVKGSNQLSQKMTRKADYKDVNNMEKASIEV